MAQILWRAAAVGCILALCGCAFGGRAVAALKTGKRVGRLVKFLSSDAAFCTLVAFTILLLRIPCLTLPQCNVDEAQWIAGANTLWDDPRFWGSVDGITSGPLVIYPLLSAKMFGSTIDYLSARCLAHVLWAAIGIFTYLTFRLVSSAFAARILSLPLATAVALFSNCEFVGYNGEHVPIFMLSVAFWLAASVLIREVPRPWQLVLLGVSLGSIPYSKLQAVPMGLAIGCVTLIWTAKWKNKAVLVASAAAPTALVFCYLVSFRLVHDFWYSYILSNLNYAVGVSQVTPLKRVVRLPFFLFDSEDTRYFFLVQCLATVPVPALILLRWRLLDRIGRRVLFLAASYLFGSFYGVLQPGTFNGHYFLFLIHPMVLASGMSIVLLAKNGTTAVDGSRQPVWAAVFLAAMVIGPAGRVVTVGNAALKNMGQRKDIMESSPVAGAIMQIRTEASSLAVWGWAPHYYVQTGMKQAARDAHTLYEITEGRYQSYYTERFVNDLAAKKQVIFVDATKSVDSKYFNDERFRHENYPTVAEMVRSRFRFIAEYRGSRIYISK